MVNNVVPVRPQKPEMASVEQADELVAEFLEHLFNEELTTNNFRVVDPVTGEEFTYNQLQKRAQARVLDRVTYSALKELFLSLPRRFDLIKRSLTDDFKRLITHRQSLFDYVESVDLYLDELEDRLGRAERARDISESEIGKVRDELRSVKLVAKEEALDKLLDKYGGKVILDDEVPPIARKSFVTKPVPKEFKKKEEVDEEADEIDFRK